MDKVTVTDSDKRVAKLVATNRNMQRDNGLVYAAALEAAKVSRIEATRQAEEQIKLLREACERAKGLICAGKGDHPNDAIRESNVNQAWRTLRKVLEATNG